MKAHCGLTPAFPLLFPMSRILFALCLTVFLLDAQTSDTPVIKVTTRLMQVSVLVHDKNGDPVSDLTKDDFVLYDKGQEQKILYVSKETNDPLPETPADIPEGAVSNRFVRVTVDGKTRLQPLPNSLTVILLDGLNTRFNDQAQAKAALVKFLKQLHPGDRAAIYTLTNTLHVLHDFTSDTAALLVALELFRPQDSAEAAAASYADSHVGGVQAAELDATIDQSNKVVAAISLRHRAEITARALQAIANQMAGLPGRKNLVWLAGDFPVAAGGRVFSDAGLAVYPVDARGLPGMTQWMSSLDAKTPSSIHTRMTPMDGRAEDNMNASRAAMNLLAVNTGGRMCVNNDISSCVRHALDDARVTYVLYFTPSHDQWNGALREIKIKINRPGLEARYRKGYYALPDLSSDPKTRESVLAEAALSPLPSTGLTMAARLLAKAPNAALSVVIDGSEITFNKNAQGDQETTVDMVMLVFGDQPTPLNQKNRTVHLALRPDQYEVMRKGGVRVTVNVDAPAGSQRVRVIARDASSGRVGSLDVPLK
jgi:VWFA-related protein